MIFYVDVDEDGFGDVVVFELVCIVLMGYVINDVDCDDIDVNEFLDQ